VLHPEFITTATLSKLGARRSRCFDVQYQIRGLFDEEASVNALVEAA
jgi:hypothetical protein